MSTRSAAQLDLAPLEAAQSTATALHLEAAERLAAHRARRGASSTPLLPGVMRAGVSPGRTRAERIAATVAERYAHSQSYRAFLAAEAMRAIEQAEAAAAVAARTAEAIVATQQRLLSELEEWSPDEKYSPAPALPASPAMHPVYPVEPPAPAVFTVRLYEEVGRHPAHGVPNEVPRETLDEDQRLALDDEIAFRQAPIFDPAREPAIPLPANLIEFPRQLVASRRARPRLAEGPLREDAIGAPEAAQLRIFEVEPEQISTHLAIEVEPTLPGWSSIRLSASPTTEPVQTLAEAPSSIHVPITAALSLRLMSAVVDGGLIVAAWLGFVTVAARTGGALPGGQMAVIGAMGSLVSLAAVYFALFFTLSEATPGMRYARIGLCTFSDDNPTRAAMRRRLLATVLAACPLGLGLLWAWLDEDGLGWHDRISRMYPRSY